MGDYNDLFELIAVPFEVTDTAFTIDGLRIEPNTIVAESVLGVVGSRRIMANTGDIVGHYVTHSPTFAYTNFGIHVGQIDRLTFFSFDDRMLQAYLIDCRAGSRTQGQRLRIQLGTGPHRKLVIPCGVAHSFLGLEGVITRNDLTMFASAGNPDWNPLNDNQVFDWNSAAIAAAPTVEINVIPLPLPITRMFYTLQQTALSAKSIKDIEVGDEAPDPGNIRLVKSIPCAPLTPGCYWGVNCFDEVASDSWMIIPGLSSCETTMVEVLLDGKSKNPYYTQDGFGTRITILGSERTHVTIELCKTFDANEQLSGAESVEWPCDPRYYFFVPDGVAFRFVGEGRYLLREERQASSVEIAAR